MRLQELRAVVQMRWTGAEERRVLLRTGVHVRPGLPVPRLVRLRGGTEEVMVPGTALAHELLVMLGERRPELLGFVRKRVRSGADAEDLLQQALVRAAEKIDGLRADDRVDAWFYRVLRNTIADHHAAWAAREAKLELLAGEASEAAPEEPPVCACSVGLLEHIRPEYAAILRTVDIEGESMAEAATHLGLSVSNTKVRLHRARKALREELLSRCGTGSVRGCQDCCCDEAPARRTQAAAVASSSGK